MKLGVRGKLFVGSVIVIVLAVVTSMAYLSGKLRRQEEARIDAELLRHARTVARRVAEQHDLSAESLDAVADRLGETTETRVTLIAPDGAVVGDSEVALDELRAVENHGQRPEVVEARSHGVGHARRYSTTVDQDMLYVAVPWESPAGTAFARVSKPLAEVDETVDQLRGVLLVGGAIAIGVALVMSLLASQLVSSELRALVRHARDLTQGRAPRRRVAVTSADELGGIAGSLNRMADDLERSMSRLAAERARLSAILESMGEAVIALNTRSRVELVNERAMELLGCTDDVTDKTMLELVRAPELQEVTARAQGGETASAELELPGTARIVLATATPQKGGKGCVIVLHDVTEIRRLERVRRDFVANVSHELRTPVSVIRANAETLLEGGLDEPPTARKLVEAQLRHAERLTRIISDLLDLSRLQAGRYELDLEPVEVATVAQRAAQLVEGSARARNTVLSVVIDADVTATADRKALDQILVNLLDNAVKYSPEGSRVAVRAERRDGEVVIEVEDNGPGIPPHHRARIFERFYRVDPGRSRDAGGTGLGLAIVKHLAEAMGGHAEHRDARPQGSIFSITLPCA